MPYTFQTASKAFKNDEIRELSLDAQGMRFLKLKSLSRKEHLQALIEGHNLQIISKGVDDRLKEVFESQITDNQIDETIRSIYCQERQLRAENEDSLITELYKLQMFDWGGLHQNNLEKTIVDNYVKKIRSFDELQLRVENELFQSMKSYVLCSWYNNWTSVIIEDIIRDHSEVLPAVGLIKKVDFFVRGIPFDLKVTYLPEGYIKDCRKAVNEKPEISILRRFCRDKHIHFDETLPDARLLTDLWCKVSDLPGDDAKSLIGSLKHRRLAILENATQNPQGLIKWLYENQGTRRFDASNKLFLILVDCDNFFDSWKLKRAKTLLVEKIHKYLDEINHNGYNITFNWEEVVYTAISDVIFVTHQRH